jgi:hypothetical protein
VPGGILGGTIEVQHPGDGLVEQFDLAGCPIYFDLVGKEKREPAPFSNSSFPTTKAQHKRGPVEKRAGRVELETLED